MKKILLAASFLTAMIAGNAQKASAHFYVTYSGQSQLTPMLVGNNMWRLDCLSAEKDCCTVDWDTNEVNVYAMVMPDDDGGTTGTPGTYHGGVKTSTIEEYPEGEDGQRTATMIVTDLVPEQ